jgi:4-amino-4-deoxy-L-arabinose transferase-like glycosyltransferase
MIAATMVGLIWTLPIALIAAASVVWYFVRLGDERVPPSRRRIRRLSLIGVLLTLPLLIVAMSVLDPQQHQRSFVLIWSVIFLLILLLMAVALLDLMNSLRLQNEALREELRDSAAELAEAMRKRREETSKHQNVKTSNGEDELSGHNGQIAP